MSYVHINRPSSTRFYARVCSPGMRKWQVCKTGRRTQEAALQDMIRMFNGGRYKRADVIITADYYDPQTIVEMVRR